MRLFQFGDQIINFDAISHINHSQTDDRHYCQIFFYSSASPLSLRGESAMQFWLLAQHLGTEVAPAVKT